MKASYGQFLIAGTFIVGSISTASGQITLPQALSPSARVAISANMTVTTTRSNQLGGVTQTQTGKYYRSSDGKTRQDSAAGTTIVDSKAGTVISINPARKEAGITHAPKATAPPSASSSSGGSTPATAGIQASSPSQNTQPQTPPARNTTPITYEDLGQQTISGHLARGSRSTVPNQRDMKIGTITTEVWTADDIGLPVLTIQKSVDGEVVQRYDNIQVGEPDASLFMIPNGYNVSQRTPAASQTAGPRQ